MEMERGAVVEKLDGAWSGDQGTIDRSVERGAVKSNSLRAWSEDTKIGRSAER